VSAYTATVRWARGNQPFTDGKYSRGHDVAFDGGVSIRGSSAPGVVRPPLSEVAAADPEEMLVAALSMCHMLFFLDLARRDGFVVDRYEDAAEGVMGQDDRARTALTRITLKPHIAWGGEKHPTTEDISHLHHKAHELCFIANSFRGEVVIGA
jgi:organic hydroperoxide reductase OsmC/OhrA